MLRSALALLSSLQIGLRVKESVERSLRQAAVVAVAAAVLIAAAVFGLVAAYHALILSYGFTPAAAAGIIAADCAIKWGDWRPVLDSVPMSRDGQRDSAR